MRLVEKIILLKVIITRQRETATSSKAIPTKLRVMKINLKEIKMILRVTKTL